MPALVVGPQLAPVAILGFLAGHWLAAVAPAALGTAAFFAALDGRKIEPRSRAHLRLGLWPFFAWWAGCVVLTALTPLALALGAVAGGMKFWLGAAAASSGVAGLAAVRRTPRVTRLTLPFPDLPAGFDGYRIVHLSDIHCGPFAPGPRVRDWVRRANATEPDLAVVTGDLIARGPDYVGAVADALGELRARDGIAVAMGNHDYFDAGDVLVRALRARGARVLRNEHLRLERAGDTLAVAGVDDTWTRRDDINRALSGCAGEDFVVLLAHDPDLFPMAAAGGARLTLSGHTHGGQLAVPLAAERFNLARLAHAYTSGVYAERGALLFVNRGAGTSGPPVRIGTRGEIALITLRRATGS